MVPQKRHFRPKWGSCHKTESGDADPATSGRHRALQDWNVCGVKISLPDRTAGTGWGTSRRRSRPLPGILPEPLLIELSCTRGAPPDHTSALELLGVISWNPKN